LFKAIKIHQRFGFTPSVVNFPVTSNEATTTSGVSTTTTQSSAATKTSVSGNSAGQYKSGALSLEWSDAGLYTKFKYVLNSASSRASSVVTGISDYYIAFGFSKDQEMGDDNVVACVVSGK
jgi:hypothetical protein